MTATAILSIIEYVLSSIDHSPSRRAIGSERANAVIPFIFFSSCSFCFCPLRMDTSRFIASRIRDGKLLLVDKEIVGDLQFIRDEKE